MAEKLQGQIRMRRIDSPAITGNVSAQYYVDTNPEDPHSAKYRIIDFELGSPIHAHLNNQEFDDKLRKAALDKLEARFSIETLAHPSKDPFYSGWVQYGSLNVLQKGEQEYRGMGR